VTLKDAAPPPVSVEAEAAIRQRSLQAELEAIAYRVAARKITRAVRQMPQKLRLRRLLAHTDAGAAAEQEVAVEQRRSEAKARRAAGKLDEPQPSGQLAGAAGFYMSMLSPGSQVDDRPPSPTPPVAPQSTAEQQPTAAAAAAAATASPAGPEAVAVNEALTLLTPAAAPDAPHNRTSAEAAVTTEREPTIVRLAVGEHGAEEAEEAEAAAAAAIVEAEAAAAAVQAAEAAEAAEVAAMVAAEEEKLQQEMAESERQEMIEAEKRLAEAQAVADEEMVKEAARAAAAEAQARADAEEREKLAAEERDKARRRANGEYVPWVQGEYCPPFTVLLEVKQEEGGEASMFARLLDVEAVEALGKARVRILPQLQGGEVRVSLFLFDPFSGDKLGRAPAWLEELERPLMPMEAARVAKAASRLAAAYKGKIARAKAKVQAERERQRQLERRRIAEFKVKEAKRKTLLRGFDVDEDSDKSVAEQLRDALSKSAVKVVDLFKDWDKDGNGKVSKEEFRKAMGLLGFSVPAEDIDALFDSWDPDGSGVLSMGELGEQLSEHKAQLEAQRKARALKKRTQTEEKVLLRGFDVDEDSDKSVAEQLRDALSKSSARVVDLFKDWDTDGNGKISREEFRKAMGLLGFSVPAEDIDALFDSWDPDGSGLLSMGELDKQLSEHKAQLEAQRKARALKRTQTASVKRLEDGEIDEAAARIAAVRNAQAERRERAAAAAKRRKSKEVSDAALAAETAATEAAAAEAAEATRKKWRMAFKLQKELTRRKLASERRMLAAAAAEAASKLEEAAAEAEPQPAQLGQLDFEAAYSYVVKGHGWQWSAELGCWPAQVGPPLWTAAQAEVYTAQANSTVWKPKIATTASLFHDVSTAQLPPSHSPTAPRVPVPPTALAPTNEASPRPRRRGVVNAVYLKQVRAHSSPELALNHL
jgi:Ca2+-binding EF-hand superfamily protein